MRRWFVFLLLAAAACAAAAQAVVPSATDANAAALRGKRVELQAALHDNPFGEPIAIFSRRATDRIEGEVYAELPFAFELAAEAWRTPAAICELLFLHLNVHACVPRGADRIELLAGPKKTGGPGVTALMNFTLRNEADNAEHLRLVMSAPSGPFGTTDHVMVFEAVPIDAARSFVHFGYAHGIGALARIAMNTYLATVARDKVGFSVTGRDADGRPQYVRGERASLERNVVRYYLALVATCRERAGAPAERREKRLRAWFALTERHPAQLREYSLDDYLDEKQRDLARMSADK